MQAETNDANQFTLGPGSTRAAGLGALELMN
jgi:hypothetical protein